MNEAYTAEKQKRVSNKKELDLEGTRDSELTEEVSTQGVQSSRLRTQRLYGKITLLLFGLVLLLAISMTGFQISDGPKISIGAFAKEQQKAKQTIKASVNSTKASKPASATKASQKAQDQSLPRNDTQQKDNSTNNGQASSGADATASDSAKKNNSSKKDVQQKSQEDSQQCNETPQEVAQQPTPSPPREPWSSLVNYNPQVGLGMRTKRHFFPDGEELVFLDGQPHTAESYHRRYHQHIFKDHYLLLTGNFNTSIHDKYSIGDPGKTKYHDEESEANIDVQANFFIWHQYYEPRWDTGHVGSSKDRAVNAMRAETKNDDWSDEKTRENSIVCFANGWKQSVDLPVDVFEEDEKIQIVETMLEKVALKHHEDNFQRFKKYFGQEVVIGPEFSKYFFTVDPIESKGHAVTQSGGIIYGIKATDINQLKLKQDGQQFFENQVQITPNKIIIPQMQQLTVHREIFEITNTANKANFTIYDVMPSSPEIIILNVEDGQQFNQPVRLRPGESLRLSVLIIPETLELIEAAIFVVFNPRRVFMLPVSIYVVPNAFGLKPMYYADVTLFETVKTKIEVFNPTNQPLVLSEAYSTEEFVTLTWPNGKEINTQDTHNKDYTTYLTIPPKKMRTVLVAEFKTRVLVDHHALIHLMFESGHIMRLPLYYHVYADLLKFLPSIVDFGVVPLNFDAIRVPVTLKIRNHSNIRTLHLTEVMLPLNDERVDFVMGEWDRDPTHHTKVFNKNTKRLEEHRQGVIYADHEFHLMTVVLNPIKYGMVSTQVKLMLVGESGTEHFVQIPVVGFVAPMQKLVLERIGSNFYHNLGPDMHTRNPFLGFLPAEALNQANVRKFLDNDERYKAMRDTELPKRFRVKLHEKEIQFPVNIFGNFRQISTGSIEVINPHPNITFEYFLPKYSHVSSMETKQLGQFTFNLSDFKIGNMKKYFWIAASHTLFPQYMQITDQRLICTVQDDFKNGTQQYCDDNIYLDYGQIGLYQSKSKMINITNIGQECVLLDWVTKSDKDDEMSVSYFTTYDDHTLIYPIELNPRDFDANETSEFLNRYTNEAKLGVWILPGHTVMLKFSLEGAIGSLKGGQASDLHKHKIICQFSPYFYRPFAVHYNYQVLPGALALTESEIKFSAGFNGLEQIYEVKVKSEFQVPINVLSATSSDPRIQPVITQNVLEVATREQTIINLHFNPGLSTQTQHNLATSTLRRDQSEHLKNSQYSSTWKLSDLNIGNFKRAISEALKTVTEDDVALWRSHLNQSVMNPTWSQGNWIQGVIEDIKAVVSIKTSIVGNLEIPVTAFVTKPKIIIDRFIDFRGVQIGSYKTHSMALQNPFNETLYVNLFIGRNTIEANDEVQRLNNYQRHYGQLELLPHAKGTKYEREILADIHQRLNKTEQFNQHQKKLAILPDIQKFCKNVRSKIAEQSSPSMHDRPETTEAGPPQVQENDAAQAAIDHETMIMSGKPFEVNLRNDDDVEMCDLLHSTMTLMPDTQFQASAWKIINNYFAKRHLENQELEAITNYQKVKEQNHIKLDPNDTESLKEHLTYKLQEQLRSLYPDSLRIADEVDREIAKDINKSSYEQSLTWDPINNYRHIVNNLAFPSYFKQGWLGTVTQALSPASIITPFQSMYSWSRDMMNTQSWSETGQKIFTSMRHSFTTILYSGMKPRAHNASTYVSSQFIDKQGRFKNVNPAPAISHQWELKNSKLHQEILKNNSTVGVQKYGQNFYINPEYQGVTYEIRAGGTLLLEDAIIFEPRTFTSMQNQMQMTLYIKSEKAILQTLQLKGWASSAVLDITQISKSVSFSNGAQDNSTFILSQYSENCSHRLTQLKKSDSMDFKLDNDCLDAVKSLELIRNQTLGKSTLPQVINLYVHESDVLSVKVENLERPFLSRLLNPFDKLASMQSEQQTTRETQINQVILWDLSVMNLGEIDFALTQIYLEDPLTGERNCQQDGLRLQPCADSRINALKTQTFSLQYVSDFSVSELRKTLVFESLDLIQRFPIQIDISAKALKVAAEYVSDDVLLQRPVFGAISHDLFQLLYSVMLGTALWVTYSLFQMYHGEDETQKGIDAANHQAQSFVVGKSAQQKNHKVLDSLQSVLATVTPPYIQNQYIQTQERFRSHSSIFLRECVNLSQRKNSITIEYQRNLAARLGKQQAFLHAKSRGGGQAYKNPGTQQYNVNNVVEQQSHQQQSFLLETGDEGPTDQLHGTDVGHSSFTQNTPSVERSNFIKSSMAPQMYQGETRQGLHATPVEDSESDTAQTDKLLQQAFVTTRRGSRPAKNQRNQHSQKTKGCNYSVDFESKLHMEAAAEREDDAASAQGNVTGNSTMIFQKVTGGQRRDDSFTLVGDEKSSEPAEMNQKASQSVDFDANEHDGNAEHQTETVQTPKQASGQRGAWFNNLEFSKTSVDEGIEEPFSSEKPADTSLSGKQENLSSKKEKQSKISEKSQPYQKKDEFEAQQTSVQQKVPKVDDETKSTKATAVNQNSATTGSSTTTTNLRTGGNVVGQSTSSTKKRKLTKQDELALKKRKAEYNQIQKQMKKQQALEAAAFELAKKERERKKQEEEERKRHEKILEEKRRQEALEKMEQLKKQQQKEEQERLAQKISQELAEQEQIKQEEVEQNTQSDHSIQNTNQPQDSIPLKKLYLQKPSERDEIKQEIDLGSTIEEDGSVKPRDTDEEASEVITPKAVIQLSKEIQKETDVAAPKPSDESVRGDELQYSSFEVEKIQPNEDLASSQHKLDSHDLRQISWGYSETLESEDACNQSQELPLDQTYMSQRGAELSRQLQSFEKPSYPTKHLQRNSMMDSQHGAGRSMISREQSPPKLNEYSHQSQQSSSKNARALAYQHRRNQTQQAINQQSQSNQQKSYGGGYSKHNESAEYQTGKGNFGGSSVSTRNSNYYQPMAQPQNCEEIDTVPQSRYPNKSNRIHQSQTSKQGLMAHNWRQQQHSEHSDEDYRETSYYGRGRGSAFVGSEHGYHGGGMQRQQQQTKRMGIEHTSGNYGDTSTSYDHQGYSQVQQKPSRRISNIHDRDYYLSGSMRVPNYQDTLSGRVGGGGQTSQIYQERMRPSFYQSQVSNQQVMSYGGKRIPDQISRRKYQDSQAQSTKSEYHYYGAGQGSVFSRGEPYQQQNAMQSQYSGGRGGLRSRFQDRYFHEEESYYGEQDYEQEEDDYGDEMADQALSSQANSRRVDYEKQPLSKHAYFNQQTQQSSGDRFFRKKPIQSQYASQQSSSQAQNSASYNATYQARTTEDSYGELDDDYPPLEQEQHAHRRYSRKEYEQQQHQYQVRPQILDREIMRKIGPSDERNYRDKQGRIDNESSTTASANKTGSTIFRPGFQTQQSSSRYPIQQLQRPSIAKQSPNIQKQHQTAYQYEKSAWMDQSNMSNDQIQVEDTFGMPSLYSKNYPPGDSQYQQQQQSSGKKKLNYFINRDNQLQQQQQQVKSSQQPAPVHHSSLFGANEADMSRRNSAELTSIDQEKVRMQSQQKLSSQPMADQAMLISGGGNDAGKLRHHQQQQQHAHYEHESKNLQIKGKSQPQNQPQQQQQAAQQFKKSAPRAYLDSDEDEDDLIKSSAKQFLKTPGSRSSLRQSFDEDDEDEEPQYEEPKPSQNFFSIFKRIQPIFSRNQGDMPNAFDPDNDEQVTPESTDVNQKKQDSSLFSGTSNLSLFGGLNQLDNYFGGEDQRNAKQSLFGGSSFFYQQASQQDLHSFNPNQQQESEQQQMRLQKQPSSLEALRMSSRPLQQMSGVNPGYNNQQSEPQPQHQQTLFQGASLGVVGVDVAGHQNQGNPNASGSMGFQWKKLEPYKPQKLPGFAANLGRNNNKHPSNLKQDEYDDQ